MSITRDHTSPSFSGPHGGRALQRQYKVLQAEDSRDLWERAMDEALEKLLQVSSDGAFYIGSVQVPKQQRGKIEFVPKVCTLYGVVHARKDMHD